MQGRCSVFPWDLWSRCEYLLHYQTRCSRSFFLNVLASWSLYCSSWVQLVHADLYLFVNKSFFFETDGVRFGVQAWWRWQYRWVFDFWTLLVTIHFCVIVATATNAFICLRTIHLPDMDLVLRGVMVGKMATKGLLQRKGILINVRHMVAIEASISLDLWMRRVAYCPSVSSTFRA